MLPFLWKVDLQCLIQILIFTSKIEICPDIIKLVTYCTLTCIEVKSHMKSGANFCI